MRILIYGESDSPGTGAWCYAETLREMGHAVTSFDPDYGLSRYRTNILARGYRKLSKTIIETDRKNHITALLKEVETVEPEIVIILKGLYVGPEDVVDLQRGGAWVVNINHDDFFSSNRNNWTRIQRAALSHYDYVLTTREVNVEEVRPFNSNVEFFPFAFYPRIHRPVDIPASERELWDVDVVFVGTWEPERCKQLESLVRAVPAKYSIWGTQWDKADSNSPLRPYLHKKPAVMDDMAKAIHGSKISLAFLRKENRDDYTQRTFEIPACGGVFLGERTKRHQQFYREGKEAEFFDPDSNHELAAKVSALLSDDSHRERIRECGALAVRRQRHTYHDRLNRLIELYPSEFVSIESSASKSVPFQFRVQSRRNQSG